MPACGSAELARLGAGTQRLERELAARLPELERIRLDADAVAKPGAVAAVARAFAATDRAVLVGTQMVAKGHHFAGVALAAVVDADTGLGLPDFRAEERTFQLLTQLAGRCGRDAPGRVLVQTFQPDARAISVRGAARRRRASSRASSSGAGALGYPPFRHLVRILVAGPEPGRAAAGAARAEGRPHGDASCSARRRCSACAAASARSSSRRRTRRARWRAGPGALLAAAAPAMRRAGLTAVVDVDPQSRLDRLARLAAWRTRRVRVRQEERDAEREARRRNALAQVRQYGDPVLRMRAREVDRFDDDLARLAERMKRLMREANGVGLAGNQVGVLQRLVVIQPAADGGAAALVNPELVERATRRRDRRRGLPLAPGRARPGRAVASRVVVEGADEQGGDVRLELDELAARVVQHELDHLDGVLILDRTTDEAAARRCRSCARVLS